ncbi:hypothetical protein POM88_046108 [Heracleum sosnowskyi]|uniref:Uncharacterized protein n=1 Tax=Heracleum sosnowskyi TaxID=360622 RepID=A0AAD8H8G1_9APIA|nr:hypothetical protein POM88_046108 [Heracleum sosnowskyi]
MRVPCDRVWDSNFIHGSYYIRGLKPMMCYYGLKSYRVVKLQYVGGADFHIRFFTPYGVQMKFPNDNHVPESAVVCNDIEEDKLCSTFNYNIYHNFVGFYNLVIRRKHLMGESFTKVLSEYACYALGLTNSLKCIKLGFEENEWKIRLKWVDGEALLNFVQGGFIYEGSYSIN